MGRSGIYGYENRALNKWYIGQSVDMDARKYQHETCIPTTPFDKEFQAHRDDFFYHELRARGCANKW